MVFYIHLTKKGFKYCICYQLCGLPCYSSINRCSTRETTTFPAYLNVYYILDMNNEVLKECMREGDGVLEEYIIDAISNKYSG